MDDLVDYSRRLSGYAYVEPVETRVRVVRPIPPERAPFTHLDVEACLRAVPWSLQECRERLEGEVEGRRVVNVLGILQVCLLGCKPFRGLTEHQVKDVRPGIPRKRQIYDCRNRPQLLGLLAGCLSSYEAGFSADTWRDFDAARQFSLAFIRAAESLLMELRRLGTPLEDPILRHRATTSLVKTLQRAADIMSRLQPADDLHAGGITPGTPHPMARVQLTSMLVRDMVDSFHVHGPSTFPEEAIYQAVAAILKPFGVHSEHGKAFKPSGIKAVMRRRPRPLPDTIEALDPENR
jgi:hypothetical protein